MPGADDGADPQGDEVDRAERAPERVFPHLVGLLGEYGEGFGCQESRHQVRIILQKRFVVSMLSGAGQVEMWLYVLYRFPHYPVQQTLTALRPA